ncbi:CsiV family protein [Marinobacter subterrani]|uniref:CsiV family protein n=1 Tax=Marinobacter subterrani TaxID=1658765 RepID=UPI0023526603|nr:CsiV family protein [Marinobacter subterrani]
MQIDGIRSYRYATRAFLAAILLTFAIPGHAQQPERDNLPLAPGKLVPEDYYRAEFVIVERIVEPEAVNEHMSDRDVEPPVKTDEVLWSVLQGGATESTLDLVPPNELYLANAAARLERSGRYRVLARAGWYQAFPPNYEGSPLRVAVGDWIEGAATREIEGHITIDRERYLHVNVHLNHWQRAAPAQQALNEPMAGQIPTTAADGASTPEGAAAPATASTDNLAVQAQALRAEPVPLELLTWIRETRRMRSEEIHFLDSPTIGVLVFFKKIEAAE